MDFVTALGEHIPYADIQRTVLSYCNKKAWWFRQHQAIDAEDLCQMCLPYVLKSLKTHDPAKGNWKNRAIATVRWKLLDFQRPLKTQALQDEAGKAVAIADAVADDRDVYDRLPDWIRDDRTVCLAALAKGLHAVHGPKQTGKGRRGYGRSPIAAMLVLRRDSNYSFASLDFLTKNNKNLQKVLEMGQSTPRLFALQHAQNTWANPGYIEWLYVHACRLMGEAPKKRKPARWRAKNHKKYRPLTDAPRFTRPLDTLRLRRPATTGLLETRNVAAPKSNSPQHSFGWQ